MTMDEAENLFHVEYWDNDAARVAYMQIYEDLDMRLFGNTTKRQMIKTMQKVRWLKFHIFVLTGILRTYSSRF